MNLSEIQIIEIADNLEAGLKCYFNLRTGEIITILDFDNWQGAEEEPWEEEISKVEENRTDFYQSYGMESHVSFRFRTEFIAPWMNRSY
ncbi:MAG: hypothetical protein WCP08_14530 [Prolixibacteraceae bacterium]